MQKQKSYKINKSYKIKENNNSIIINNNNNNLNK